MYVYTVQVISHSRRRPAFMKCIQQQVVPQYIRGQRGYQLCYLEIRWTNVEVFLCGYCLVFLISFLPAFLFLDNDLFPGRQQVHQCT